MSLFAVVMSKYFAAMSKYLWLMSCSYNYGNNSDNAVIVSQSTLAIYDITAGITTEIWVDNRGVSDLSRSMAKHYIRIFN